ncbi:family 10 glycosylhydrolase [Synechocystis sp. PCC 7509]|uniref:family 10 glycosylhydrolase n=1 Tax=Synechocystis sp. PCC 7509 TaxID=927677 RepID=UPI0002ABCF2A|nr:family 10 glycosylhydrolase [Synechocystis sp. PCC 7509]
MPIKLTLPVLLPAVMATSSREKVGKNLYAWLGAIFWGASLLPIFTLPAKAVETEILGVVKSEENTQHWQTITTRLQASRINYCVIDLASVRSVTDLSDRPVVFLPNIETISPAQAIALESWMSKGGRIITSGAIGNRSQPGVRQLMRSLLGGYWGFGFKAPSKLQPLKTNSQQWVKNSLGGTAWGGTVIPTSVTSQTAAVWQMSNAPSAVVTTERTTLLGWNWGTNAATTAEFDTAWLKAALSRHVKLVATNNTAKPKNCNGTVASNTNRISVKPKTPEITPLRTIQPEITRQTVTLPTNQLPRVAKPPIAISPNSRVETGFITPAADEPLDRLAPRGLIAPNAKTPITGLEAIALRQELDNLIGRFESAQLAASSRNHRPTESTQIASSDITTIPQSATQALDKAREIAKTLPQLVSTRNYTKARSEWLKASQLLWDNYPTSRPTSQPEIRAMWLDRGTIVRAGSEQGLAKIFDKLAASGINTVFLETVNAGYPIYPSKVAPQANPLVKGWDPLESGVKLAHERGIELHAWVWAFAVGNQRHNTLVNLPTNYPGPVIAAHPDWASYDNRGNLFPLGQNKPFLDPANPEARQYLLALCDEIAQRYKIDGLQLDYIRYPFQDPAADRTYGYGRASRQQFKQLTGVDPTKISPRDRLLWQKWTNFRTAQIDSFVAQVAQKLRKTRPNVIMSVAVFPLSEHDRLNKLQQHWEVWAQRGDVDLIIPMTYALDTYRFQRLAQPWISSINLGSALIVPGIRLFNLTSPVTVDQIQLARDLPISGYALFAVENLNSDLQNIFQRTQGKVNEPIPYRQPFGAAAARFTSLQQQWDYLLANNQLVLVKSGQSTFNAKAKVLETALAELAANPTSGRLSTAKTALAAFELQFIDGMRFYRLENPYQFKVWLNRIDTIERLLVYGDRMVIKKHR